MNVNVNVKTRETFFSQKKPILSTHILHYFIGSCESISPTQGATKKELDFPRFSKPPPPPPHTPLPFGPLHGGSICTARYFYGMFFRSSPHFPLS